MKMRNLLTALMLFAATCASAEGAGDSRTLTLRLGLNIGGTMPLDMPASIRSLNSYSPLVNPQIGATVEWPLNNRLGIEAGLRLDRQAMRTDADVKGYHMEMTQGEETVSGLFTGGVVTKSSTWGVTVPVQLTCHLGNEFKLRVGPMVNFLLSREFSGYAYDGYLRNQTPVGERIEIGHTEDQRGNYDFSDDMRSVQFAVGVGVDWRFSQNYGVYVDVQCGLNGAFKSSFKTIEQTLHPVYCTIGLFKQIH